MFAQARDCLLPMGITSENVAHRYGITRQEQDQAAVGFMFIHTSIPFKRLQCLFLHDILSLFRLNLIGGLLLQMLLVNSEKKLFLLLQRYFKLEKGYLVFGFQPTAKS